MTTNITTSPIASAFSRETGVLLDSGDGWERRLHFYADGAISIERWGWSCDALGEWGGLFQEVHLPGPAAGKLLDALDARRSPDRSGTR